MSQQIQFIPNRVRVKKPHKIFLSLGCTWTSYYDSQSFLKPLILYLCAIDRVTKTSVHATYPTNDLLVCDLNRTPNCYGKTWRPVSIFPESPLAGEPRERLFHIHTVNRYQTPHKIALPVYVTVTNKRSQPLTTTLYNSLVLSFSLLTTKRRLIKHRCFLRVLRSS